MRVPRQFLRDSITVSAYAGTGARGPTYGSPAALRASVQPSSRLVVLPDGRQVIAELLVLVRPEEMVPVESKVSWSGGTYRVLAAMPMPDQLRPTHIELVLGAFV